MSISYARLMADRDSRPCDACGRRARCAPSKRFGGLICAPCAVRVATAAKILGTDNQPARQDFPIPNETPAKSKTLAPRFDVSCAPKPAPELRRRGVTQFASVKVTTCDVSIVRELERSYRAFRRFPGEETREQLIAAVAARCAEVKA